MGKMTNRDKRLQENEVCSLMLKIKDRKFFFCLDVEYYRIYIELYVNLSWRTESILINILWQKAWKLKYVKVPVNEQTEMSAVK